MTVVDIIRQNTKVFAPNKAVIEGEAFWTHAQLWARADSLSNALIALGLSKGGVVLAWLPNCHEAIESELAVLQSGGVWVTLHASMTWTEVAAVVRDTSPRVIITSPDLVERIDVNELDEHVSVIVTGLGQPPPDERWHGYEELVAIHPARPPKVTINEMDVARLRYTSGTTGSTRAAVLLHRTYLASLVNQLSELHVLSPEDRVLHVAPLTHASGALVFPILATGGANVLLPRFDAEEALELIQTESVTTMFTVPTILQRLARSPSFQTRDLSSLRTVSYGGAPMPVDQLVPVIERLGPKLLHIYGMTECLHPATTLKQKEHWTGNPKLGSIGKPTPLCEAKIVDSDGNDLPDNEVGEIWVRGPNLMAEYWRDEEETRSVLHDGWLATGDMGYRDEDGYFYIVDRKKDVIISGGFNVYPREVEAVLCNGPGVIEAAVVGVPHDDWGEAVQAVVVVESESEMSEDALLEWCRERLSAYKLPKSLTLRTEPLPRSPVGKILKRELLESCLLASNESGKRN